MASAPLPMDRALVIKEVRFYAKQQLNLNYFDSKSRPWKLLSQLTDQEIDQMIGIYVTSAEGVRAQVRSKFINTKAWTHLQIAQPD